MVKRAPSICKLDQLEECTIPYPITVIKKIPNCDCPWPDPISMPKWTPKWSTPRGPKRREEEDHRKKSEVPAPEKKGNLSSGKQNMPTLRKQEF